MRSGTFTGHYPGLLATNYINEQISVAPPHPLPPPPPKYGSKESIYNITTLKKLNIVKCTSNTNSKCLNIKTKILQLERKFASTFFAKIQNIFLNAYCLGN